MSAVRDDAQHGRDEQGDRYEWPRPPTDGWTADDLDRLPDLPPHTELIDGSLVFMSPQADFHMATLRLLEHGLISCASKELYVVREMSIRLDKRNRPEPDLMVVPRTERKGSRQTWYEPEVLLLAVEITSPDSEERDREVKPLKYARAGIPHFWRVENVNDAPVVYVYELDPATHTYAVTGIHHKQLKLDRPFPVDIDLTDAF
ncbi:Uma2 family endonuclease [Streptomyces sp. NPDC048057]|uniref:Uma2 family endonuclease n=1 Tax=Streptomyces sp. NPDC048057 TaxID=3155628 RepID=UPI0033E73840